MRARNNRNARNRSGSALVGALALTMTIAALSVVLLQGSLDQIRLQASTIDKRQSFYLAEAGLAEATANLRMGGTGNIGTADVPAAFGDGGFWVETVLDSYGLFHVECTGVAGRARTTLGVVLGTELSIPATLGIFGDDSVIVRPGAVMSGGTANHTAEEPDADAGASRTGDGDAEDGDAEDGDAEDGEDRSRSDGDTGGDATRTAIPATSESIYSLDASEDPAEATARTLGRLSSNGSIVLESAYGDSTVIDSDVRAGVGATLDIGFGVEVSGSTSPNDSVQELPEIPIPPGLASGDLGLAGLSTATVASGAYTYGAIQLSGAAALTIEGPASIVVDRLHLGPGATLTVDGTNGPVRIVAIDGFKIDDGSTIVNATGTSRDFELSLVGDSPVDVDGDGVADPPATFATRDEFRGMLYAPATDLAIAPGATIVGSVAAGSLDIGSGAEVTFDEELLSTAAAGSLGAIAWQILSVPEEVSRDLKSSILGDLAARHGDELPSPAAATMDPDWSINFVNREGDTVVWVGEESRFDWSQVASTVASADAPPAGSGPVRAADVVAELAEEPGADVSTSLETSRSFSLERLWNFLVDLFTP